MSLKLMSYSKFETIISPNSDKALRTFSSWKIKQRENIKLLSDITGGIMSCLIKTKKAAEHLAVFVLKMRDHETSRTLPDDVTASTLPEESLTGVYWLFHHT